MNDYVGMPLEDIQPSKIVVNMAGETISELQLNEIIEGMMSTKEIRDMADIVPDIIFVRGDGWTLAAPPKFEAVAYNMWRDKWVGFVRCPELVIDDIANYVPGNWEE
jgi:hypothetical protein